MPIDKYCPKLTDDGEKCLLKFPITQENDNIILIAGKCMFGGKCGKVVESGINLVPPALNENIEGRS